MNVLPYTPSSRDGHHEFFLLSWIFGITIKTAIAVIVVDPIQTMCNMNEKKNATNKYSPSHVVNIKAIFLFF